jgi:hypothetical protein
MDDASVVSRPTEESWPGGGSPPDDASPSPEPMSAKIARLLAHGFPH